MNVGCGASSSSSTGHDADDASDTLETVWMTAVVVDVSALGVSCARLEWVY